MSAHLVNNSNSFKKQKEGNPLLSDFPSLKKQSFFICDYPCKQLKILTLQALYCFQLFKDTNLKAIHNFFDISYKFKLTVFNYSKILI